MIRSNYTFTGGLWLVTGAAGFIGSHLVETLLREGQRVRAVDNFSTGFRSNIEEVKSRFSASTIANLEFVEGDVRDRRFCQDVLKGVAHVSHQAGLGSVPRSLLDPVATNEVNVSGFLNMLDSARTAEVQSFVYAASSSTYGDEPNLPKVEDRIGRPLSPYAVSKLVNEIYAENFKRCFDFRATGLRYFNVFGPRQDPNGAYAAVIPRWSLAMIRDEDITINGDGTTSRDFCYVDNAVQANIRATLAPKECRGEVYNVAVGQRTSLLELAAMLKYELGRRQIHYGKEPVFGNFRKGDVQHSLADIGKARNMIGYEPLVTVEAGIQLAVPWYIEKFKLFTVPTSA